MPMALKPTGKGKGGQGGAGRAVRRGSDYGFTATSGAAINTQRTIRGQFIAAFPFGQILTLSRYTAMSGRQGRSGTTKVIRMPAAATPTYNTDHSVKLRSIYRCSRSSISARCKSNVGKW